MRLGSRLILLGRAAAGRIAMAVLHRPLLRVVLVLGSLRPLEKLAVGKNDVAVEGSRYPSRPGPRRPILAETDQGVAPPSRIRARLPQMGPPVGIRRFADEERGDERPQGDPIR